MAGIDSIINTRADAFTNNPQGLMQRYAMSQDLLDLLALQKLKQDKEAAQRSLQMQMQSPQNTVKDQLEGQVMDMTKQEVAQSVGPGIQQQGQRMQAEQLQQAMGAGLGGLQAPAGLGMAQGGIVGYAGPEGSSVRGRSRDEARLDAIAARARRNNASTRAPQVPLAAPESRASVAERLGTEGEADPNGIVGYGPSGEPITLADYERMLFNVEEGTRTVARQANQGRSQDELAQLQALLSGDPTSNYRRSGDFERAQDAQAGQQRAQVLDQTEQLNNMVSGVGATAGRQRYNAGYTSSGEPILSGWEKRQDEKAKQAAIGQNIRDNPNLLGFISDPQSWRDMRDRAVDHISRIPGAVEWAAGNIGDAYNNAMRIQGEGNMALYNPELFEYRKTHPDATETPEQAEARLAREESPTAGLAALPARQITTRPPAKQAYTDAQFDPREKEAYERSLRSTLPTSTAAPAAAPTQDPRISRWEEQLAELEAEKGSKTSALIDFLLAAGASGGTNLGATLTGGGSGLRARDARLAGQEADIIKNIETLNLENRRLAQEEGIAKGQLQVDRDRLGIDRDRLAAEKQRWEQEIGLERTTNMAEARIALETSIDQHPAMITLREQLEEKYKGLFGTSDENKARIDREYNQARQELISSYISTMYSNGAAPSAGGYEGFSATKISD